MGSAHKTPERVLAHLRARYRKNPERFRAAERGRGEVYRSSALLNYGGKCTCCGEEQYEFLVIDHVNGGGDNHRREIGRGAVVYRWLADHGYPDGFQVLCHNCNSSLGHYGYCPHRPEIKRTFGRGRPAAA